MTYEQLVNRPKILYIPTNDPIHDEWAWKTLNENFDIINYDFDTIDDYIKEVSKPNNGSLEGIKAICRSTNQLGLPYKTHLLFKGEAVKHTPKSVEIIVQSGHGFDVADIDYLTNEKIVFCNSPSSCDRATADVGVYLILSAFRYLTFAENCVRTHQYDLSQDIIQRAQNPEGKILGIIGLGDIGYKVARAAAALGMKIVYNSRSRKPDLEQKLRFITEDEEVTYYKDIKDLYAASDCIFISCPYTKETHHLINSNSFKLMKSKVRIVNVARGPIVSEKDVIEAIKSGQLIGAAFDVHEFEPKIDEELLKNYNVTLLPHVAVASRDSFEEFERKCVKNLMEYFYGSGIPNTPVNPRVLDSK